MFGGKKSKEQEAEINRLQLKLSEQKSAIESLQGQLNEAEKKSILEKIRLAEMAKMKLFAEQDNLRLKKRVADLSNADGQAIAASETLRAVLSKFSDDICDRIIRALTVSNLESSRKQLERVFGYCRSVYIDFDETAQVKWMGELNGAYSEAVLKDQHRQEQSMIREKMREEVRAERERKKELDRLVQEEDKLKLEIERIMLKEQSASSALEIEELKLKLLQAHDRMERAKSQAELTRAGHVYVISNIGSFGAGIYKVGMTRRLEPMDRVQELGDASVPFPFDVHMMISCEDAPTLEANLHRFLHKTRLNKINLRKEYFKIDLETIRKFVEENHGHVDYYETASAFEFYETRKIEERGFEQVYDESLAIDDEEDLEHSA